VEAGLWESEGGDDDDAGGIFGGECFDGVGSCMLKRGA
jgi:hypothetical protein